MTGASVYFNEEHKLFRKTVRAFAENEIRPHAEEWERAEIFPKELFQKAGKLGLLGVRYNEKYGGTGLDYWYTVILCEELVRGMTLGAAVGLLAHAEFATSAVHDEGSDALRQEILADAIRGEVILALGITEPNFGSNVAGLQTTAKKEKDSYVINGSKTFITNGTRADYVIVAARTGGPGAGGISLITVPTDTKGFSVGRKLEKIASRSSDTAELFFQDCRVPTRYLIGEENKGFSYILKHFQGERLVLASFANALMQLMIEEALKYGGEREIFGKFILQHQVWRHRLAELLTWLEASRQLTYYACHCLNSTGQAHKEVSMAKLLATETAKKIANDVFQLHGGYAVIEEYPICRLYREASGLTIGAGTSEIMREIIAAETIEKGGR
jgi:citronellyl-CoA dehydrogenase